MVAYTQNAPAGFPGFVTRELLSIIEAGFLANTTNVAYGWPVKFSGTSGKYTGIASGDTAAVFAGILARTAVQAGTSATPQNAVSPLPDINQAQSILKKGYVNVTCFVGTPVRGGVVYMRVTTVSSNVFGQLEATADSTNSVALPGVEWAVNGKDANNVSEIWIK
jgi:hypothetical protein